MFYAITDHGVVTGKNLNKVNKSLNGIIDKEDCITLGPDQVVKVTNKDLDFIQDKKRLSMIPMTNLYKPDSTTKYLLYFIAIMQFFMMFKK